MSHDYCFDVFNIVPGCFDGSWKTVFGLITCAREDVGICRIPFLFLILSSFPKSVANCAYNLNIFRTSRLEQNQPHFRMINETRKNHQVSPFPGPLGIAGSGRAPCREQPGSNISLRFSLEGFACSYHPSSQLSDPKSRRCIFVPSGQV